MLPALSHSLNRVLYLNLVFYIIVKDLQLSEIVLIYLQCDVGGGELNYSIISNLRLRR